MATAAEAGQLKETKANTMIEAAAKTMIMENPKLINAVLSLREYLGASRVPKASGHVPNFAPNFGINVNAVADAY